MDRPSPPKNPSPYPRFVSLALLGTGLFSLSGCSSAEEGTPGAPAFSGRPFAGGSSVLPPGSPSTPSPVASGGAASVLTPDSSGGGALGSEGTPGGGGATPLSGSGGASNTGNGTAGAQGGAPGGNVDPGDRDDVDPGNDGDQEPPVASAPGRAGAELCPEGPLGDPLPANPVVTPLFSVGENNFFIFEGPVWVGDALFFSEIGSGNNPPPSRIHRFVPGGALERNVIANSGSNGLGVDGQGNLIAATHDVGAISSFDLPGGARTALGAQTFDGQRFNSPNDLVLRNDGNVYFTDPTFQAPGNPQGGTRVYRISPAGVASIVDASLGNPNGITLSPDGNTLYVTSASGLFRYALAADGTPGPGINIDLDEPLQTPDGVAMDCAGNLYTTEHFRRLIRIIAPNGEEIARFGGPQAFDRDITNLAFGGPERSTLFVTTITQGEEGGLFSVELDVPGLPY